MFGTNEINIHMYYYVYIYYDPITNVPFYVGKGKENRIFAHLKETAETTDNKKKFNYINKLRKNGVEPIISKFKENMSEDDAYDLEEALILKFGRKDFEEYGTLTNICLGSRPPVKYGEEHHQFGKPIITHHTEETKKKISDSKKGKESWHKGRVKSIETRSRMSAGQKNKVVSGETRSKISIANIGNKNPGYGTMWITDGEKNLRISKAEIIPTGWVRGRTFKEGYKNVRN